jgi:Tol biopolymer transport system component
MTMDMVLERIRAANPVQAREANDEMLFRAIVATPCDSRLPRRRRRVTGMRLVVVALVVFLVLAATATATYFALRSSDAITFPQQGGSIVSVAGSGTAKGHPVWQCPGGAHWCGEISGIAWSPDGERLALSLWEVGANSSYVGFHLIDPRTGTDRHIPAKDMVSRFGCVALSSLTWSPNGKVLAYTCRGFLDPGDTGIYTIRPDGTGRRLIATGPLAAYSPTWSPDSKRLAFSTGQSPFQKLLGESISYRSAIYVIDLAGKHARRIATGALPDWSPNGKTIAYYAPGCEGIPNDTGRIRLVTPTGRDVTPPTAPCDGIGPARHPVPAWSPDSRQIAVSTNTGLYLMNANGTNLQRLRQRPTGSGRPAWRPK